MSCPDSSIFRFRNRLALIAIVVLLLASVATFCRAERIRLHDASWQNTFDLYRQVPCLTAEELEYGSQVITGLDYNSRRIFRKMCLMEGINFAASKTAWSALLSLNLSYEQMLGFEQWYKLENIDFPLAMKALTAIKSLSYEAGRSFRLYCALPDMSARLALETISLLNRLDDAQHQAVQGLLALPAIQPGQALNGLETIPFLHDHQARAAGTLTMIEAMSVSMVLDALPLVRQLSQENAWNARTLFLDREMNPLEAWYWLVAYFANPTEIQEQQFSKLDPGRKERLVMALYDGGEELIWKINNLHAVTDRFGFEVSNYDLQGYSAEQLLDRFEMLSPPVRSRFGSDFYPAGKAGRIAFLKQATAAERVETARRLTSVNIYALLAQGSELYDSSFRDILVPVLYQYVKRDYNGNLLNFLTATDPANRLISSFIVSLAQKGKLTAFLPDNTREQEQILDLVAESAFKDEDAIILFSATFMYLLEVLEPEARTFLVSRMCRQADEGAAAYSRLITVILQYYIEEYPHLLSDMDRMMITRLLVHQGAINLYSYLATPFSEWKKDNKLSSISVFHPDDDGRESFISFFRTLLNTGYKLTLSRQFTIGSQTEADRQAIQALLSKAQSQPAKGLAELFSSMRRNHFAVSLVRSLNDVTIDHAAFVYSGEHNQERLLERFVLGGAEMFAQRGHSYWRSEQIIDPLDRLREQNKITDADLLAKQRFLSLGSCGGVKAYTRLNDMFLGKVDILASIGTGLAVINDPYNKNFFEVVARNPESITWKNMAEELAFIFQGSQGRDYLQPGSLPAILHKILNEKNTELREQAITEAIMIGKTDVE